MKETLAAVLFGKNNFVSGTIAICIVASIVLGCNCGKGLDLGNISDSSNSGSTTSNSASNDSTNGEVPPLPTSEAMVHDLTADFARAIDSNDFSDIYSEASTDFQNTYTEEQMKKMDETGRLG